MKKEIKIRIFCLALVLLGVVLYIYTSPKEVPSFPIVPHGATLLLTSAPGLLYISLLPAGKIRKVDYSRATNFIGVLFCISTYIMYCLYFFKYLQNNIFIEVFAFSFFAYFLFLIWYKSQWTSQTSKNDG